LDADLSVNKASGISIKNGIESSIEFYNSQINVPKFNLKLIALDHRGNTRRSLANFKKAQADPKTLAVFGGLHSPPLITNNNFINDNQILTFVSWAAGGPITRSQTKENWIYRLSIDDAQAGGYIAKYATKSKGCKKPFLLLEKTPWGKSNKKNMTNGLSNEGLEPRAIELFGWGVSKSSSLEITDKILKSNADCIFFVGNPKDAKNLFTAFSMMQLKLPIFSHWGITGGDNLKMAQVILKSKLEVHIIQTQFSFLSNSLTIYQKKVRDFILDKYNFKSSESINPMSGWVHSFDLTQILLKTLEGEDQFSNAAALKKILKKKLEDPKLLVKGLIKKYTKPFSKYNKKNKYSHEALRSRDFTMRKYDKNGNLK